MATLTPPQAPVESGDSGRSRNLIMNMGPQHPSTHGVLRMILELDGEVIVKARPDIGYLHTGIEKSAESKLYQQVVTLTDRIDYLAPLCNNLAYVLAVEKLLQLEIPRRAQWTRVMLAELTRLNSHLVWLGTHALDIGAMTVFLYCFREREELLKIFEMFSGQRMMTSYFRIGGLALEPPLGWAERVKKFLGTFPGHIDEYETLLTKNNIWVGRTKDIGYLSGPDCIAWGVTGPCLRAVGLPLDLRKSSPYSSYEEFDFDVPTRTEGDVYARYLVRVAEMRESVKIIRQAVEGMPEGAWKVDAPGIVLPDRDQMKYSIESLIYHFKIVTEGFKAPRGEAYHAIEGPRGQMGYYVVSDGGPKPYRCHMRSASFANLQALPKMIEGRLLADVVAIIGSIDIVLGDVDR
ncbi:MAG: NADH dehydrogenase (quinone) subunit D [Terriglobales bacterium]